MKIFPNKLKNGDEVRIVAPYMSLSTIEPENIYLATQKLESLGLKVTFGKHVAMACFASAGITICTDRDKLEVEYALCGLNKPVGIFEYQLTKDLPSELADKMPSAKLLEEELSAVMQLELFAEADQ